MATINRGEGKKENKGVHLQALNVLMILLACIVSFFLLYAAYKTTESYGIMQDATEEYISCQQDAENMQDASDYLTEQARSFAVTGDPVYVQNFFRELEVTRRRDTALENMGVYLSGTDIYESLKEALEYSNELVNRECYSMCLTIASREYELADFPEALQKVELSPEASTEPFTVTVPDAVTRTHPPPLPPLPHVLLTPLDPGSTGAAGSSYGIALPYWP